MGTAPDAERQPVMPDPKRVVTRSLAMLAELGYTRNHAVDEVISAATVARRHMQLIGMWHTAWFDAIIDAATERAAAHPPENSDQKRGDHADGSSSSTSGPAGQQEER